MRLLPRLHEILAGIESSTSGISVAPIREVSSFSKGRLRRDKPRWSAAFNMVRTRSSTRRRVPPNSRIELK